MQAKYRPDGWLGFLLGSTYFYDMTKEEELESKIQDFLKALGGDGKVQLGEGMLTANYCKLKLLICIWRLNLLQKVKIW